ncbi:hypothetical protein LB513_16345 [Mesorhizobium sp. ES1-1]|nr:hypothetical protein [Mesorhizobium sp. ES1-1]
MDRVITFDPLFLNNLVLPILRRRQALSWCRENATTTRLAHYLSVLPAFSYSMIDFDIDRRSRFQIISAAAV